MDGNGLLQKDRQGKTGGVPLFVKGNFYCCGSPRECLWVKIREVVFKGNISVGNFY